jgi:ABC-type sugar transport system permease subunit
MELSRSAPRRRGRAEAARRIAVRALAVALVFALALVLRLRAAEALLLDYDEDDYLRAGQLYAGHLAAGDVGAVVAERENYEHPPLTKLAFGAILLRQGPASYAEPVAALKDANLPRPRDAQRIRELVTPLRTFGAVAGALTAAVVAAVNPLAGLIVAVSSWQIKYSSQAMLEALPSLFAACALLTLGRSRRNGDGAFWLAAVFLGLTAAGTYRYAAGGLAAVAWILWRGWGERRRTLALAAAWGAVALLVFYAFDPALWLDPLGRLRESLLFNTSYSAGQHVQEAGFPWFQPALWLLGALPWNPGAVPLRLDGVFGLLALLAAPRMLRAEGTPRLTALWLLANLGFLFLWPTKWPQYVLALTVPGALAAARWLEDAARVWRGRRILGARGRAELRAALPWLWPAGLLFLAVAVYPIALQLALAATNFQTANLRAGQAGFWEAFARGALTLPPMQGNPLEYYGLGPVSLSGWLIYPLRFNILWVAASIGLATCLGLALASILHRPGLRGRNAWLTLLILPWAIPEFVAALVWQTIFDEDFGALNNLLSARIGWLSDPAPLLDLRPLAAPLAGLLRALRLAPVGDTLFFLADGLSLSKPFWVLVLVSVWVCFPFMLIISGVALRAVPAEVHDAARVDGASGWAAWRLITWPLVAPSVVAGALLRGALLFNAFYLPQLLIGESHLERTGTAPLALIAYFGVVYSDYPFAAYMSSAVLVAAALLVWAFNRRVDVIEGMEAVL